MKNKKIILSSILSLVLCLSVIAGATFALFTSESGVNVAINSGKVEVLAHAENLDLYSPTLINTDGTVADDRDAATETTFKNGGTATITDGNKIVLDRMTPGDKVTFEIVVENNSNVTIQYQTKIALDEGIDLFSGLKVTLEKDRVSTEYDGMTAYSQWATLNATGEVERTAVTIELPTTTAGNEYQELSCKLAFSVSAVQGNTYTEQPEENTVYIYNATDLLLFAKSVNNGNGYSGQTVKLMDDIDLAGIEWKPIGQPRGYSARAYFQGTFDGNGKTISNLNVPATTWEAGSNGGENFATGFFGFIDAGGNTIKNVTFANANVEGHHWVGVVAGYMSGTVSGVKVTNSTVTSTYKNGEADGDKAGGVVGYLNQAGSVITGCTVENCVVSGVRDCGGIVGFSVAGSTTSNNTVKDTTVYYSTDNDAQIGGEIMGKRSPGANSNNTHTNVTVTKFVTVSTAAELSSALNATYNADTTIKLGNDIDLAGVNWESPTMSYTSPSETITINGNGHTIKNLTSTGSQYGGLIGKLATNGNLEIKNIKLENVSLTGTNVDGECAGGALIGWMDCHDGTVTVEDVTVTSVNINGFKYTGGLIGYKNDDTALNITSCTVTGTDTAKTINSSYNENGNYKGHIGGLVGYYGKGTMSACTLNNIAITRSGVAQSDRAGVLVGTLESGASVTSATVSNVTLLGIPVTSASYMVGPGASNGSVSGVTLQ